LGCGPEIAGVIVAEGSFLGAFSLYVEEGRLKHTYSFLGLKLDTITSRDELPKGKVNVRYEFTADKPGEFATSGTTGFSLMANRKPKVKLSTPCRSGLPLTKVWTSAPTTVFRWCRNLSTGDSPKALREAVAGRV